MFQTAVDPHPTPQREIHPIWRSHPSLSFYCCWTNQVVSYPTMKEQKANEWKIHPGEQWERWVWLVLQLQLLNFQIWVQMKVSLETFSIQVYIAWGSCNVECYNQFASWKSGQVEHQINWMSNKLETLSQQEKVNNASFLLDISFERSGTWAIWLGGYWWLRRAGSSMWSR